MDDRLIIRPALPSDRPALLGLTDSPPFIHRHLDWRAPLDWLGSPFFWLAEKNRQVIAALACPLDATGTAWIRLFAARENQEAQVLALFKALFEKALQESSPAPATQFAAISLFPWFDAILRGAGFRHHQEIIVLEWNGVPPSPGPLRAGLQIRPMQAADLPGAARVDQLAFSPLWQLPEDGLALAFAQAAYAAVALQAGQVVGYQISTAVSFSAHLARLAVLPELQRQSIATGLVTDLLEHFWNEDLLRVTVNTQADNIPSLSLYRKLGFSRTGENFDVFVYP